jgi:excisionase family DNA binding protein
MRQAEATKLFDNQEELLTYEECAQRLKISVSGLQKLVYRRELPFMKFGQQGVRFYWSEVVATLRKGGFNGPQNKLR